MRCGKAKALGLIDPRAPEQELPDSLRRWETLSDEDKALYVHSMRVNAGMLEAMDFRIGRLFDFRRRTGRSQPLGLALWSFCSGWRG